MEGVFVFVFFLGGKGGWGGVEEFSDNSYMHIHNCIFTQV